METVATEHAYGSADYYAAALRDAADRWTDLRMLAYEFIRIIDGKEYLSKAERMGHVAAILDATEQVRTEQGAAR